MKKRIIAMLLVAAMVLPTGCKKPVEEPVADVAEQPQDAVEEPQEEEEHILVPQAEITTHTMYTDYKNHSQTACTETFGTVSLDEASAREYPKLQEALEADSKLVGDGAVANFGEMTDAAYVFEEYQEADIVLPQGSDEVIPRIYRNDGKVLTVRWEASSYNVGAAHGMYGESATNYDVTTGAHLQLSDVLKASEDELVATLKEQLLAQYPDTEFDEVMEDTLHDCVKGENYSSWYLGSDSVTFYFGPYLLAAYAAGAFEVNLSMADYPEYFNPDYFTTATDMARVYDCNGWGTFREFDLDGDGSKDPIRVSPIYDSENGEGNDIDGIQVYVGENVTEISTYSDDTESYYLADGDGHYYLYQRMEDATDGLVIEVFELTGSGAKYVDRFDGKVATDQVHDSPYFAGLDESVMFYAYREHPIVRTTFDLDQRIDPLSTTMGRRSYTIGLNGMPTALDEAYMVVDPFALTTLVELEVTLVIGAEESKMTLPVGTELEIESSDGATYVQGRLMDGSEIRIDCDLSWPQTVNGMDAEQVFDGIFYAG